MKPIEIYRDKMRIVVPATAKRRKASVETLNGDYRWRVKARNGKIIAASSEGFSSRAKCLANLQTLWVALYDIGGPSAHHNIRDLTRAGAK